MRLQEFIGLNAIADQRWTTRAISKKALYAEIFLFRNNWARKKCSVRTQENDKRPSLNSLASGSSHMIATVSLIHHMKTTEIAQLRN